MLKYLVLTQPSVFISTLMCPGRGGEVKNILGLNNEQHCFFYNFETKTYTLYKCNI